MEQNLKFRFFMSQLTHIKDIKETDKTKLSFVLYQGSQNGCILRICKGRDLSAVCEALRRVRNPNAAVVYDYVYEQGDTYILEECLDGRTVLEHLKECRIFSEKETARIILGVCGALEELHGLKPPVVHNDINPSNIMLREDGSVKLFDFDISRLYKRGANQNTVLFGTEEYASPEHFGYGQSEPRTDIYCLGVTMHKMLTGEGLSSEHRMTYRGGLKSILERCLEFDPKDRYTGIRQLRKDLERFLSSRRYVHWGILAVAVLGVCVALVLAGGLGNNSTLQYSTDAATATTTLPLEIEETNSAQIPELLEDQVQQRRFSNAGEEHWYTINPSEEPSAYRIQIDPSGEEPVNGRTFVQLYDQDGILVKQTNLDYGDAGALDVFLTQNRPYSLKVYAQSTVGATGTYSLQMTRRPCTAGREEGEAMPLKLGVVHGAFASFTLECYYCFTAEQTGNYTLRVQNRDVGEPVYFCVTRDGGSLASGWAHNGSAETRTFRMEQGDKVVIAVRAEGDEADGTYSLCIEPA